MRKENRIAKLQTPPRSTTPRAGEQPIAARYDGIAFHPDLL
ncbi:MAG: hypothetical protein ACOX1P_20030 [Thermoguttaceae bacterium]